MKKISQISWKRYLESAEGQATLDLFTSVCNNPSADDVLALAKRFDPQFFTNMGVREMAAAKKVIKIFIDQISEIAAHHQVTDQEEFDYLYVDLISGFSGVAPDTTDTVPESTFRRILADNIFITTVLYCYFPQFCIPNFYPMQFGLLKQMAEDNGIELPAVPQKNRYWDRNMYYLDLCDTLREFAADNGIQSMAELCTFLYGDQLPLLREALEESAGSTQLPQAAQVWMISGNYGEAERDMGFGFWQANAEVKRGDILLFYEKSPVKAINAIWRAETDGCYDPFFYYSSYTYIGHKTPVAPISCEELRTHAYFSQHPFVTGNFENGKDKRFNSEDYSQLLAMLAAKGFDCSALPALKAHEAPSDIDFSEKEAAVHKYLVLPLLESMGWTEANGHVLNQVVQHVGRGETRTNGRTDISLHPYGPEMKMAKVVIEEKYWMKNEAEKKETFDQGASYARLSEAKTFVICDKAQIIVFPKKKDSFAFDKAITFYWDEMPNPDKFNELRKLLS